MKWRLAVGSWRLALATLCLVIVGCGRPAVPESVSYRTTARANEPMRVALLPLIGVEGVGRAAHSVDEALLASIRTLGTHEAVPVAQERARQLLPAEAIIGSAIGTEDLLHLRDALRVDAVLIGRIEQFQTYDPVAMGITVHLVSVEDGAVLWSASAHLDSGRTDVQKDLRWWHEHANGGGLSTISGWRLAMSSPSLFSRYVADRLVETIPEAKK